MISIKILSLVNQFIKSQSSFLPFIEKVFINTLSVFELKDALGNVTNRTTFQEYWSENADLVGLL